MNNIDDQNGCSLFALFAQVIQSLPVSELCDVFSYGVVSAVTSMYCSGLMCGRYLFFSEQCLSRAFYILALINFLNLSRMIEVCEFPLLFISSYGKCLLAKFLSREWKEFRWRGLWSPRKRYVTLTVARCLNPHLNYLCGCGILSVMFLCDCLPFYQARWLAVICLSVCLS